MKRIGALALATALAGSLTGTALADEANLVIAPNPNAYATVLTVNGAALNTAALPAVEGVPMRLVAEADHGSASWFQEENAGAFYFSDQMIEVSFADYSVKINDQLAEGVTAQVVNGVTFLPVAVLEGLEGITVEKGENSLTITTPNHDPLVQLAYAVADAAGIAYGMKVDQESLSMYGIDGGNFDTVTGFFPMITSPDTVIIGKVADGKLDAVTEQLEAYRQQQYDTFSWYLSQNLPKVENAKTVTSGDYLLFVIGEDADAGVEAFEAGVDALAE